MGTESPVPGSMPPGPHLGSGNVPTPSLAKIEAMGVRGSQGESVEELRGNESTITKGKVGSDSKGQEKGKGRAKGKGEAVVKGPQRVKTRALTAAATAATAAEMARKSASIDQVVDTKVVVAPCGTKQAAGVAHTASAKRVLPEVVPGRPRGPNTECSNCITMGEPSCREAMLRALDYAADPAQCYACHVNQRPHCKSVLFLSYWSLTYSNNSV